MAYVAHANAGWYHYGHGKDWAWFDSPYTKIKIELKDGATLTGEQQKLLFEYFKLEYAGVVELDKKRRLEDKTNEQKQDV